MMFAIGQQVRTTCIQLDSTNLDPPLPAGSIGTVLHSIQFPDELVYNVDFGNDVWQIPENELEAMGSE